MHYILDCPLLPCDAVQAQYLLCHLSVCLSVTLMHCVKTGECCNR